MTHAILIYDSKCSFCRAFKETVTKLDKSKKILFWSYYSPKSKELLKAQFGKEYGFSLYLFEKSNVSIGGEAVKACFRAIGKPAFQMHSLYPLVVRLVSLATGRKRKVQLHFKESRKTARTNPKAKKMLAKNI